MKRVAIVLGTSVGLAVAVLALVLGALSISFGRWEAVAFYAVLCAVSSVVVVWLFRLDRREHPRAVARRVPRQPIRLPLRGAVLTFAGWYAAAAALSWLANGRVYWFDLAIVAPFASFLLSVLTFAGRHIAFRLTAEEAEER